MIISTIIGSIISIDTCPPFYWYTYRCLSPVTASSTPPPCYQHPVDVPITGRTPIRPVIFFNGCSLNRTLEHTARQNQGGAYEHQHGNDHQQVIAISV